jgi:hypothetical protein
MSVPEKPIFLPNDPASFGASGPPFRESSGRTLRRKDSCGERSRASDDRERRPRRRRDPLQGLGEGQKLDGAGSEAEAGENYGNVAKPGL